MNGLSLVDFPSSRKRTRSDALATCRRYSTILSHRASLLSVPMRNPKNCSGAGTAVCAPADSAPASRTMAERVFFMAGSRFASAHALADHAHERVHDVRVELLSALAIDLGNRLAHRPRRLVRTLLR